MKQGKREFSVKHDTKTKAQKIKMQVADMAASTDIEGIEPHQMFTSKQLWDAFNESYSAYQELEVENESLKKGFLEEHCSICTHNNELQKENERLRDAARALRNEVWGTVKAHETAIRYSSGHSNWERLEMALKGVDEALGGDS